MTEMIPHLRDKEKKTFYHYLGKASVYFEYGSGGSTYQAFKRDNIKKVYSVESDLNWINKIYQALNIPGNNEKLTMIHVEMDANPKKYGRPGPKSSYNDWIKYSRAFSYLDDESKNKVDLVLIDGRFRVACLLNLFNHISDSTIILFDDFYNRRVYHIVLNYYDVVQRVGKMAVLKKKNIDPPTQELIFKYENDPS